MVSLKRKFQIAKSNVARRKEAKLQIRQKAQAAALRERETQEIRVAEEREKIRAERKIKRAKEGGFAGQLGRQLSKVASQTTTAARTTSKRRRKGKKKGKKKTTSSSPPKKPPRDFDFTSGGSFI